MKVSTLQPVAPFLYSVCMIAASGRQQRCPTSRRVLSCSRLREGVGGWLRATNVIEISLEKFSRVGWARLCKPTLLLCCRPLHARRKGWRHRRPHGQVGCALELRAGVETPNSFRTGAQRKKITASLKGQALKPEICCTLQSPVLAGFLATQVQPSTLDNGQKYNSRGI